MDRSGLRETIVRSLEAQILRGELAVGARLPSQRELERAFHASRPVVREALHTLAERQLVRIIPGKGAFVSQPTPLALAESLQLMLASRQATVRDLVEARRAIEGQTAWLAAERATAADLAALELALKGMAAAGGLLERVRWDVAFHLAVARAAQNPLLEVLFLALVPLAAELMVRSWADPVVAAAGGPYHQAIAQAIHQRDPAGAREALLAHLAVPEQLYGDDYTRPLDWVARRELGRVLGSVEQLHALLAAAAAPAPPLDPGGAAPGS
jgi:GntR family transcriptional repressor for pyruvate dehydrogenase complex